MAEDRAQKASRRIFTYWVNQPGSSMPVYIQMCMQTWMQNIPDMELVIVNQDNLFEWIDPFFAKEVFVALSLPMQKDVVSYALLYKYGGIFMDADTIVTKDIFAEIEKFERDKIYLFGNPQDKSVHVAFLACIEPKNAGLLSCIEQEKAIMQELLEKREAFLEWYTFGNAILDNVIKDEVLGDTIRILDRKETGAILEASFFFDANTEANYINFYFNPNDISIQDACDKIKFGAVCLHNSWSPVEYRNLTVEEFFGNNRLISRLLKRSLGLEALEGKL